MNDAQVMTVNELTDDRLHELACHWRAEALRGLREARGIAHELEAELRRRKGVPGLRNNADIDLRPLLERGLDRRWWRPR